jgi:hypothetical protein
MVTPVVSKLLTSGLGPRVGLAGSRQSKPFNQEGARSAQSTSSAFAVQSTSSHTTATQSLSTACCWKRPWTRTSGCRGVGVTTACRRGRAVADAAEPMVFPSEGGSLGSRNPQPGWETRGRSEAVS